ncbi:FlgD immunoglobulin-like domain containing protein, partial [Candidatus Neomarinimicrobiota bacterium]
RFDLPETGQVQLIVYDIMGREVLRLIDELIPAGYHQAYWDGRDATGRQAATGIYFARLVTLEYTKAMKMLLLK